VRLERRPSPKRFTWEGRGSHAVTHYGSEKPGELDQRPFSLPTYTKENLLGGGSSLNGRKVRKGKTSSCLFEWKGKFTQLGGEFN